MPLDDLTIISFSMLANNALPTPQERKNIEAWFDKRDQCWKLGDPVHATNWPQGLYQLSQVWNTQFHKVGLQLYSRKITFGEADRQIQDLADNYKAQAIQILKQYKSDIDAQKAATEQLAQQKQEAADRLSAQQRADYVAQEQAASAQAEAERQRRAQALVNYFQSVNQNLQQQQQQQRQAFLDSIKPKPTYMTNCSTFGNNTTCTTQ